MSAWVLGSNPVPPFMLATCRAAIVLLVMGIFLFRKRPQKFWHLLLVCACVGPIHLGFLYSGLQTASASSSSIVSQILIPFATILSVVFLKEKIGWVRGLGILGAFAGTIIMIYEPGALTLDFGLIYIVGAYFALACGSILMKTVGDVDWRQYVVWTSVLIFVFMGLASFFLEHSHLQIIETSWKPLLITACYAALCVSIAAHGQYFNLIKLYDVSHIVPLTLMTPLLATIMGIGFLNESLTTQMMIGGALIMPCVYIIARRQNIAPVQED